MKRFPYAMILLGILTACTDGGTPSAGYVRPGHPSTTPYTDAAKSNNKSVTNMIVTNDAQAGKYIKNRLNGYTGDKKAGAELEFAKLAIQIADGTATYDDIDESLLNPAMYILNPELYSDCAGVSDVATCVNNWKSENSSVVDTAIGALRENAIPLNISNAKFITNADTELTFTVDSAGNINSIVANNIEYTHNNNSGNVFTAQNGDKLTYETGAPFESGQDLKLSYSDFGVYNIKSGDTVGRNIAFAGGYTDKRINDITAVTDDKLVFDGRAVGTVSNGTKTLNLKNGTARLVFDAAGGTGGNPVTTIGAEFSNWYNFTVTQDGNNTSIEFNKNPADKIESGFDPSGTMGTTNANIGYYGPAGIPTEATGTIQYDDEKINMDVAFGVN